MRLASWNCASGELRKRTQDLITGLDTPPDLIVLQECGRPSDQNDQCVWIGDPDGKRGIGVVARGQWRVHIVPPLRPVERFFAGVEIVGPVLVALLAVCIMQKPYASKLKQAAEIYSDFLKSCPAIILGDFNMDVNRFKPDKPAQQYSDDRKFIELSSGLEAEFNVVNATRGRDRKNTLYHNRKVGRIHQIDHCFVPREPVAHLEQAPLICEFDPWVTQFNSDHVPLILDLRFEESGSALDTSNRF